jgi:hypothetical protein
MPIDDLIMVFIATRIDIEFFLADRDQRYDYLFSISLSGI